MVVITAVPTIRNVLYSGSNLMSMTPAGGTVISAGQIVTFHATGVSMTVHTHEAATIQMPIGVAIYSSAASDGVSASRISIAGPGCICYVANDDTTKTIDAGDYCIPSSAYAGAATGFPPGSMTTQITGITGGASCLGIWLDDVAGGGTGRVLIMPQTVPVTAA